MAGDFEQIPSTHLVWRESHEKYIKLIVTQIDLSMMTIHKFSDSLFIRNYIFFMFY